MKKFASLMLGLVLLLTCAAQADGIRARLVQRLATRTGPGTEYTEPGSFLSAGDYVTVHTKVWDPDNEIWWVQVEFTAYNGAKYRVYTGAKRVNVNVYSLPTETSLGTCSVKRTCWSYAGPGTDYVCYGDRVYSGTTGTLYALENGYGLIDCRDSNSSAQERVWVSVENLNISANVSSISPVGKMCTITGGTVNCRTGAGEGYPSKAYVYRGSAYYVYDVDTDYAGNAWYKIYTAGQYLWINADWAAVDGMGGKGENSSQMCTITASSAACRLGVGSWYSVVDYVYRGDSCYVHETSTDSYGATWLRIYVVDRYVWIRASDTNWRGGDVTATAKPSGSFPVGQTCVIISSQGNARTGAGMEYSFVSYVYDGESYTILDTARATNGRTWYQIRLYSGRYAWISSGICTVNGVIYD